MATSAYSAYLGNPSAIPRMSGETEADALARVQGWHDAAVARTANSNQIRQEYNTLNAGAPNFTPMDMRQEGAPLPLDNYVSGSGQPAESVMRLIGDSSYQPRVGVTNPATSGGTGYGVGGVGGPSIPGITQAEYDSLRGIQLGQYSGASGGSGGGLVQGVNVNQYQQNPYLSQMGDVLTNRVTDSLQRQIMPGIRSNAVAAGGFGGSRQGVVEANAMRDANQTISDALTGAYFQDFTNQMNRNLAQYGQNQNFFSNQRGQDLQQLALGANLFQQGNQGWLSQGQGLLGLGQTQQQAPWQVINNANAGLGQWSGYGTTTSANQGGGAQGTLGGMMAGGQLGSLWGGAGLNSGSQLGKMSNSQIEQSWGLPG